MASKKYRDKLKLQRFNNQQSTTYKSRQAFGKAVKRTFQSLPKDPSKRVDVIHHIAQVLNVIPAPKHHKPEHRSLPNALKELVINFYNRDDVSYQMPGKWDCITVDNDDKKITLQKRILLYSIRETYQLFIADKNDPNINLSKTSFSDLRPLNILVQSHMSHRSCLCVYHENINLPLKALSKQIQCPDLNTLQAFSLALVCDEEDEKLIDQKKEIKWYQWILNEGFAKKQEFNDTIQQCLADLQEKIKPFLWHVFIKRQQTSYFEQMKSSTNDMKHGEPELSNVRLPRTRRNVRNQMELGSFQFNLRCKTLKSSQYKRILRRTSGIIAAAYNCGFIYPWCRLNTNPYNDPIANDTNTEICEQTFAWLAQYKNIVRGFNESTFLIYICLICDLLSTNKFENLRKEYILTRAPATNST
ncbi:unnamed protein product [Rotaria magnacalcarata]|uniref:Uncharacterized protein n=1 Tax=Rotaria magnacalcarata TaxID=392030 RepID=A0A816S5P6_9BILA|nr:unnamed protein product [Rotaria magnacalcarata]